MGDREACVGGDGIGCGDARNHFKRNPSCDKGLEFFAPTSEDKGISPLEPDDASPFEGTFDKEGVDVLLWVRVLSTTFAHGDALDPLATMAEDDGIDQSIIKDDISTAQTLDGTQGEEIRVSRTCAYKGNNGAFGNVICGGDV